MYSMASRSAPAWMSARSSASVAASSTFTPLRARPRPTTRGSPPSSCAITTAFVKLVPQSMPATNGMLASPNAEFETLVHLLQREKRRARGADELRVRADFHLLSQDFLECRH